MMGCVCGLVSLSTVVSLIYFSFVGAIGTRGVKWVKRTLKWDNQGFEGAIRGF
jgi:hypothetical protein